MGVCCVLSEIYLCELDEVGLHSHNPVKVRLCFCKLGEVGLGVYVREMESMKEEMEWIVNWYKKKLWKEMAESSIGKVTVLMDGGRAGCGEDGKKLQPLPLTH